MLCDSLLFISRLGGQSDWRGGLLTRACVTSRLNFPPLSYGSPRGGLRLSPNFIIISTRRRVDPWLPDHVGSSLSCGRSRTASGVDTRHSFTPNFGAIPPPTKYKSRGRDNNFYLSFTCNIFPSVHSCRRNG